MYFVSYSFQLAIKKRAERLKQDPPRQVHPKNQDFREPLKPATPQEGNSHNLHIKNYEERIV